MSRSNLVEIRQADRPARYRTTVDDTTPIIEYFFSLARTGVNHGWMRFTGRFKPADPLVHVPAEGSDDADVVVVPHVAVGYDVQTRFLLIADHRCNGIVVSLFVLDFLERDTNVAAK